MHLLLYLILITGSVHSNHQTPEYQNGTYTYDIAFAEWGGKSFGSKCIVIIEVDSIKVINDGSLTGNKGEIIDHGVILKHKSGEWIISHNKGDADLDEVGGCSDGPSVISI